MGKLEENKKQKQEALFNSAYALFTEKGINKTTISEIVDHAGIAKGTFYLYFKDKYDICNQLLTYKLRTIFSSARQALLQTDLSSLKDQLMFLINHVISYLDDNHVLLSFIVQNMTYSASKMAFGGVASSEAFAYYKSYLNLEIADVNNYNDLDVLLFTVCELVNSTCYSCILYNKPVSFEEYKPHLYKTIDAIINSFKINAPKAAE